VDGYHLHVIKFYLLKCSIIYSIISTQAVKTVEKFSCVERAKIYDMHGVHIHSQHA